MRNLKDQNLVHDNNYALFPFGAIINEDTDQEGTPVVREVYNDLLMNIYAFLNDRGVIFNNQEDNEQNGYQLIEALRKNINVLNDTEKILNLNNNIWEIDLDFNFLPDKYFVFARASENYSSNVKNIFGASGGRVEYSFESTGFKSGDELLLIIDKSKVRAYNVSDKQTDVSKGPSGIAVFGTPLRYISSLQTIWYEEKGRVFTNQPKSFTLENMIRTKEGNQQLQLLETFEIDSKFVSLILNPANNEIFFYVFYYSGYLSLFKLEFVGNIVNNNNGIDFNVHIYFDGSYLYISNRTNSSNEDNVLDRYLLDLVNNQLIYENTITLHNLFVKTTSSIADEVGITNYINGKLWRYEYSGTISVLGEEIMLNGSIFRSKDNFYYYNDNHIINWAYNEN